MADSTLGAYVNDQFIFYGSTLEHRSTARFVKKTLGIQKFPFFAVLHVPILSASLTSSIAEADNIELLAVFKPVHDIRPEKIMRFLTRALEVHGNKLATSKKDREKQEAELSLFTSQRSERDEALRAARQGALEEQRIAEAVKAETDKQRAEAKRRAAVLKALPPEPQQLSVDGDGVAVIAVALRLPTGHRIERRFVAKEALGTVLQWADAVGVDLESQELVMISPVKKIFRSDRPKELQKSLIELNLPKSLVLLVQNKKDISSGSTGA